MQTFRNEPTAAPKIKANARKINSSMEWSTRSGGDRFRAAAFHEPRNPNAAFVEQTHGKSHCYQGQDVRRRRDNRRQDKDEHHGVRPGARHESVSDQSETHQGQNHDWQFESETKTDRESRRKRVILLHRPSGGPAERFGVAKEKENGFG